jgi:hypothetical protein
MLWDGVHVEAGASVTGCIVADTVVIPAGATYADCAIVSDAGALVATPLSGVA